MIKNLLNFKGKKNLLQFLWIDKNHPLDCEKSKNAIDTFKKNLLQYSSGSIVHWRPSITPTNLRVQAGRPKEDHHMEPKIKRKKFRKLLKKLEKHKKNHEPIKCPYWSSSEGPKNFNEARDDFVIRNYCTQELFFQKVSQLTPKVFYDKRNYINNIECEAWSY